MNPPYQVQQPKELESMAMVRLGDWIAVQAEELMTPTSASYIYHLFYIDATKAEELLSRKIETIRNFLNLCLPTRFHNKLFTEATRALSELLTRYERFSMKGSRFWWRGGDWWKRVDESDDIGNEWPLFDYPKQCYVIGRIVETLFTEKLTCISLDYYAIKLFGPSFYSKSYLLTGLTRLHLSTFNIDEETEINIIQSIKRFQRLKYLSIDKTTDDILICIATHCKLIEELKITNLNDESIGILEHLPNLKIIDLNRSQVHHKGIVTLLTFCKNIEHIIGVFSDIVAVAIEYIMSLEEHGEKTLKLKSIEIEDEFITLQQLKLIVQTCPQIRKMKIITSRIEYSQSYLMAINDLSELHELELENYDFYAHAIRQVFEVRGSNLLQLHLNGVINMDLNALVCISQTCLYLECLTFSDCTFIRSLFHNNTYMPLNQAFKHLKNISLLCEDVDLELSDEQLLFLLSNCPKVESIDIMCSVTDDIMLKALNRNPMVNLKELRMNNDCSTPVSKILSKSVIDRIVKNCINPPKVIW